VTEFFNVWVFGLIGATLSYATPLTLAALGGLVCERAGVINIALEGLMVVGAFFAIWGSVEFGWWGMGLLCAIVAAVAFSSLHAVASITFRANQVISGTALILIAQGLIDFLNLTIYGAQGTPASVSRIPSLPQAWKLVGGLSLLVPLAAVLVWGTAYVIFRTPFGLHLRAVGEHPKAADTVGINVFKMRYIAVLISGAFGGLAGAYLSFDVGSYTSGMVGGKGFIALAALIFGKWNPYGAMAAAGLFGFSQALADALQTQFGINPALVTALPYAITLVALAGFVGKSIGPAAAGEPYVKG
jgi:simple sugar transport system permease protein